MSRRSHFPFPDVLGNEFETSVNLDIRYEAPDPDLSGETVEKQVWGIPVTCAPVLLTSSLPAELEVGSEFTTNGFKFYDGSLGKDTGYERVEVATPEVLDPDEQTVFMRAGEQMVDQAVVNYINSFNEADTSGQRIAGARIQNRVRDSHGNSWGCHDNFGYTPMHLERIAEPENLRLLAYFLATRPLVTGSGAVTPARYLLSQKVESLESLSSYGFHGRMFRTTREQSEITSRIEISSSDYNVLDWPATVRAGGVALLFAAMLTGEAGNLCDRVPGSVSIDKAIDFAKAHNDIFLRDGGEFKLSVDQQAALDFQEFVAEYVLKQLEAKGIEIPEVYLRIGNAIVKFCQDLRASAKSGSIFDVADRAEWAARYSLILKRIERDRTKSLKRDMFDDKAREDDLLFDHRRIYMQDGNPLVVRGLADQVLKRPGVVQWTVAGKKIDRALVEPPDTRARNRADLMRQNRDRIIVVSWGGLSYYDEDGNVKTNRFPDALNP